MLPRNPSDTSKKICLAISVADHGCAACQFAASSELPLIPHRIIAVIVTMDIVIR